MTELHGENCIECLPVFPQQFCDFFIFLNIFAFDFYDVFNHVYTPAHALHRRAMNTATDPVMVSPIRACLDAVRREVAGLCV